MKAIDLPAGPASSCRPLAVLASALVAGLAGLASPAVQAHEPIARCVALDAQTVRCRGGYGHGEDAPGAILDVVAEDGKVLIAGKLGDDSTFTFTRPDASVGRYYVLFDVGPGHQVIVEQEEIAALPPKRQQQAWMQLR